MKPIHFYLFFGAVLAFPTMRYSRDVENVQDEHDIVPSGTVISSGPVDAHHNGSCPDLHHGGGPKHGHDHVRTSGTIHYVIQFIIS